MERRTFSPEFKAQAVFRAMQPGANKLNISRELEISNNVLHRWIRTSEPGGGMAQSVDGVRRKGRPRKVIPQITAEHSVPDHQGAPAHHEEPTQTELYGSDSHEAYDNRTPIVQTHQSEQPARPRGRPRLMRDTPEIDAVDHQDQQNEDISVLSQRLERISCERDMLRQMLSHYFSAGPG
jgi:transposase-like protein